MSFRISLSGMNAASADLNVTSHNIANVNTAGFKQSRAEFADVFPVSPYGLARNAVGAGVRLAQVAQQFTNGNVDFTGRALDVALTGQGFFTLSDGGQTVYSRAGNFGVNRDGYVVNPSGHRLQAFQPSATGNGFDTGRIADLRIPTGGDAPPKATTKVELGTNLPANSKQPIITPFDAADPTSYNYTTSVTIYDSQGSTHTQTMYFVKTANPNEWQIHTRIDGDDVGTHTVTYDENGLLMDPVNGQLTLNPWNPANGAAPVQVTLATAGSTQYGNRFGVGSLHQNGNATGRMTSIEVSPEGVVFANYTNGVANPIGQLALTNFTNPQGLQPRGDNAWSQTHESGDPRIGSAGSSEFGLMQGGALESSNVELTEQLVNMITAQRNFQANAQMVRTHDQINQTIINLR